MASICKNMLLRLSKRHEVILCKPESLRNIIECIYVFPDKTCIVGMFLHSCILGSRLLYYYGNDDVKDLVIASSVSSGCGRGCLAWRKLRRQYWLVRISFP